MNKKEIRNKILTARNSLCTSESVRMSKQIFQNLKSTKILDFKNILVYNDFKNEVKTDLLIEYLHQNDREVYVPKCDISTKIFLPVRHTDKNNMKTNIYGIYEPADDFSLPSHIECAIVPGVAFDIKGNRIGFGAGYYDKYFSMNAQIFKIGLCYEFQLLDEINADDYDVPMDVVITENRIIYTK